MVYLTLESHFRLHFRVNDINMFYCGSHGCSKSACSPHFKGFTQHRAYLAHVRYCPKASRELVCQFRNKCRETFTSYVELMAHVNGRHVRNRSPIASRFAHQTATEHAVRCIDHLCGESMFPSIRDLKLHIVKHHAKQEKFCFFDECGYASVNSNSFAGHISRNHREHSYPQLNARHFLGGNIPDTFYDPV